MRNLKKVLSLVLCMAMMLSVMVVGAGAAFEDQDQIQNTEAVEMCVALNIISGFEDGTYKPENTFTRAQACKMICIALNGGKEPATATKVTPTYSDIAGNWAEGYIEYCSTKGIVSGVGGGKFNPNGYVTASQYAKMLLTALGYNAEVQHFTGESWELYVNVQANQDGIYTDLEAMDLSENLTRDNAAQMTWNAMQAYTITKSSTIDREDGSISDVYTKGTTDLLNDMYGGKTVEGTLTQFDYNSNDGDWDYTVVDSSGNSYSVNSANDYTALLGQNVKAVYDNTTSGATKAAYGIFAVDSQVMLTGIVGDLPSISAGSIDVSFKVDGTTYKTDDAINATEVYVFTEGVALTKSMDLDDLAGVTTYDAQAFEAIDKDGDNKIDFFMMYPVAVAKVASVSATAVRLTRVADPMSVLSTTIARDEADIYDGIAKNDYVVYTAAANTVNGTEVLEPVELVTGEITKMSNRDATIDGTVYTFDAAYLSKLPAVGTTMTDAVVVNGYIFDVNSVVSSNPEDYVVAVSTEERSYGDWSAKLLFSDGSKTPVAVEAVTGGTLGSSAITVGQLYTYTVNSSDEYTLTPVVDNCTGGVQAKTSSNDKAAYIAGNAILDDSIIFVNYGTGLSSYKVISGATLKTMDYDEFSNVLYLDASTNVSTGVGDVNFAYIQTVTGVGISSSDEFYGYITKVSNVKDADNKSAKELVLWTDAGEVTLTTKGGYTPAVADNTVIVYTLDAEGNIDAIDSDIGSGVSTVSVGAVTAITEDFMTIGTNQYFDDDVAVVTVETDETAGVAYEDCDYTDIGVSDGAMNVFYVVNSSGDVVFVAYDVDNKLSGLSSVAISGATATATDLTEAFASTDDVTISGNLSGGDIPAGKSAAVAGNLTGAVTGEGSLSVDGTVEDVAYVATDITADADKSVPLTDGIALTNTGDIKIGSGVMHSWSGENGLDNEVVYKITTDLTDTQVTNVVKKVNGETVSTSSVNADDEPASAFCMWLRLPADFTGTVEYVLTTAGGNVTYTFTK